MLGRQRFASPGLTTDQGSDLKLQRWSWRWYNSSSAIINTCQGFQLLRWGNFSWLLHLPGKIALAGSKSWGLILLTREAPLCRCSKLNLAFDTCRRIFESFPACDRLIGAYIYKKWQIITFRMKKWKIITISCGKVKNHYFSNRKVTNLYLFVK